MFRLALADVIGKPLKAFSDVLVEAFFQREALCGTDHGTGTNGKTAAVGHFHPGAPIAHDL